MEQHIREPKGGEAIVDMILRCAKRHVQKELLCDGNHNVLLGKRRIYGKLHWFCTQSSKQELHRYGEAY